MTDEDRKRFIESIQRPAADVVAVLPELEAKPPEEPHRVTEWRRRRRAEAASKPRGPRIAPVTARWEVAEAFGPDVAEVPEAVTVGRRQIQRDLTVEQLRDLPPEVLPSRPRTRADCEDGARPCPWVGCKWHLYLEVTTYGSLVLPFGELELDRFRHTCALDVADRGGITLEQTGEIFNLTRERIRQVQEAALEKVKDGNKGLGPFEERKASSP